VGGTTVEVNGQDVALVSAVGDHDAQHAAAELRHAPVVTRHTGLRVGLGPVGVQRRALDPGRI
jgi:sugar/nucleoside kinase (ribokinase family)